MLTQSCVALALGSRIAPHLGIAMITSVTARESSISEQEKAASAGRVTLEGDVRSRAHSAIERPLSCDHLPPPQ